MTRHEQRALFRSALTYAQRGESEIDFMRVWENGKHSGVVLMLSSILDVELDTAERMIALGLMFRRARRRSQVAA